MSTLLQLVQVRSTRALDMMAYLRAVIDRPDRLEIRLPWVGNRLTRQLFVEPDVLVAERRAEQAKLDNDGDSADRRYRSEAQRISADALDAEEDAVFGERWQRVEKRVPWISQWQEAQQHGQSWRAVLLGIPGQGKSALVDMTAHALAQAALSQLQEQTAGPDELVLPIVVTLKHLLECDVHGSAMELLRAGIKADLVDRAALPKAQADRLAERLTARLDDPRTFLLLDGLDEVEPQATLIARLFDAASKWQCRLILTARTYGYKAWSLPFDSIHEYGVAPLTLDQARAVLEKWQLAGSRRKHINDLLAGNRAVQQMSQNPFLLSLILAVGEEHDLPAQITRTQLYGRAVEMALGGKSLADEWMPLLEELAWIMWKKNPRNPRINGRDLLDLIELHKYRRGRLVGHSNALREELSRKRRLLVPEGKDRLYVFPHRSIPAFLAACHLALAVNRQGWSEATVKLDPWKKDVCQVCRFVDAAAWHPEGREVVILLTGLLLDPAPLIKQVMNPQPPAKVNVAGDDLLRSRLCLAAQCLTELETGSSGAGSRHERALQAHHDLIELVGEELFKTWSGLADQDMEFEQVRLALATVIGLASVHNSNKAKEWIDHLLEWRDAEPLPPEAAAWENYDLFLAIEGTVPGDPDSGIDPTEESNGGPAHSEKEKHSVSDHLRFWQRESESSASMSSQDSQDPAVDPPNEWKARDEEPNGWQSNHHNKRRYWLLRIVTEITSRYGSGCPIAVASRTMPCGSTQSKSSG